jgi:GNAT superfamily N-acetyltransferase
MTGKSTKRKSEGGAAPGPKLTFRAVTKATWPDFEALFEGTGGPKYCWCMAWRSTAEERTDATNATRKAAMRKRVDARIPVGILGYAEGQPIAWCSIAPRDTYRPLGGPEAGKGDRIWSIVCFFVRRDFRGNRIAPLLVEAAMAEARKRGATLVESYPVAEDAPSYRYMGFVPMFRKAGFRKVGTAGTRRTVMRRTLT